jgi:hypothetical protein
MATTPPTPPPSSPTPPSPDPSSFKDIRDILKEINAELNKQITNVKDASKSYSKLETIAKKLQNDEESLSTLSKKQLQDLKSKAQANLRDLETTAKKLNATNAITSEEIALLQAQQDGFKIEKELVNKIQERLDKEIQIQKTLGVTGALLKGISKIPIIGDLVDTEAALEAARKAAENGKGSIMAMGAAIGSLGKSLVSSLADPAVQIGLLVKGFSAFYDLLVESDKATAELAKGMNMSYNNASKLREQYASIQKSAQDTYITVKGLQESQLAIAQTLGTTAKLNEQDLKTFTKLRDQAGYTNEELTSIERLTLAVGGNLEDNVKSFAGTIAKLNLQNKLTVNEKTLLKDISKVSDSIKLSVGGTAESIATAAFKAKQFGINLEQADQISKGLLNFEESISDQISAELITGKQLNFEKARLLALNGDIAGASSEILEQVGGTAEFANMNRIQQEAIAKAVGLSRDDLAKSLVEREALQKIGAKDAEEAERNLRARAEVVGWEKAIAESKDEAYAKQLAQNAISEDFNKIIEQLKELFIPIAQELLPKIKEFLETGVAPLVEKIKNSFDLIVNVVKVLVTLIGVNMVTGIAKNIASMGQLIIKAGTLVGEYVAMAAAWAIANPIAAAAGLVLAAGVGAAVYSQIQDGEVSSDGLVVGKYNKGAIQPIAQGRADDNVIFTTNKPTQANTNNASINIDVLLEEQRKTNALLAQGNNISNTIANKNINVQYDSQKAGTAADVNSYRISSQFITT